MTRTRRYAVVFFLWFIFIFSQLGFLFALHEEHMRSPPRKTRVFFKAESSSFRATPASSNSGSQMVDTEGESYHSNNNNNNNSQGQGKVYEDDKRVIHTGPNPLHN